MFTTKRIAVRDLNANDVFVLTPDPKSTVYVCDSRRTGALGEGTRVNYHVRSDSAVGQWSFVKPSLTNVYVLD